MLASDPQSDHHGRVFLCLVVRGSVKLMLTAAAVVTIACYWLVAVDILRERYVTSK